MRHNIAWHGHGRGHVLWHHGQTDRRARRSGAILEPSRREELLACRMEPAQAVWRSSNSSAYHRWSPAAATHLAAEAKGKSLSRVPPGLLCVPVQCSCPFAAAAARRARAASGRHSWKAACSRQRMGSQARQWQHRVSHARHDVRADGGRCAGGTRGARAALGRSRTRRSQALRPLQPYESRQAFWCVNMTVTCVLGLLRWQHGRRALNTTTAPI